MSDALPIVIKNEDLPVLFTTADAASGKAQKSFIKWMALDLSLIVFSSIAGAFSYNTDAQKSGFALLSAISMSAGIFFTLRLNDRNYEQNWYDGRALAESVKTRAWRFMTCSEPYREEMNESDVKALFVENLKEVQQELTRFTASLGGDEGMGRQITPKMLSVRQMPILSRKAIYVEQRVNDQRKWYADKSKSCAELADRWSSAILGAQGFGCITSFVLVRWPNLPINISGIFAAMAAAFIAWLQLKRYRELATSYGLTAHELGLILEQSESVDTSDQLSAFILDAENAISREHTTWRARRDGL